MTAASLWGASADCSEVEGGAVAGDDGLAEVAMTGFGQAGVGLDKGESALAGLHEQADVLGEIADR